MTHDNQRRFIKEMFFVIVLDSWVSNENLNTTFDLQKLSQPSRKKCRWGPQIKQNVPASFCISVLVDKLLAIALLQNACGGLILEMDCTLL